MESVRDRLPGEAPVNVEGFEDCPRVEIVEDLRATESAFVALAGPLPIKTGSPLVNSDPSVVAFIEASKRYANARYAYDVAKSNIAYSKKVEKTARAEKKAAFVELKKLMTPARAKRARKPKTVQNASPADSKAA